MSTTDQREQNHATDQESAAPETLGVLELMGKGFGFLRSPEYSFQPGPQDIYVPPQVVRTYRLVHGAEISGLTAPGKKGEQLTEVQRIAGVAPDSFQARTPFDRLTAISPDQRFHLGQSGLPSMRVMELIAPIGKGTRGLIVAPPKSGKTRLLQEIAQAIHHTEPQTRIIALLIDERPEEVTQFRRNIPAEVLASSSDQPIDQHTRLAELTMAHVRTELEVGRDVVVLVDSITRLVRAFNLHGRGSGRTMSGGIDARATEIPRRLFGLARNIEKGGSVTVIGTALIETGSQMDDYVYEELKSTGNSELVLDRSLAESRIFPAVNIPRSGTRREDLLFSEAEMIGLTALRRWLSKGTPKAAMVGLLKLLDQTKDNEDLLARLAKS